MDRVSCLPDELLAQILSFLPTKEAALTSVLSKRWRNLLAIVPILDIDDSVFLHPEEGKGKRQEIIQSFMDFVDRVLQGDSLIKKFSLKCRTEVDRRRVDRWICNVLQRGVSYLELLNDAENNYWQSSEVFRSKTLVELKLGNVTDFGLRAGDCFLPMLKSLVLESVFCHNGLLQMLLPGCPLLEEFELAELIWLHDEVSDMTVSSASLKTLAFHPNCYFDTLSLETPSLVYLEYSDFVAGDYPLVNLENLVEAQIKLKLTDGQIERARAPDYEDNVFLRLSNVWKLVQGIRNVHKLYLSANTVEVLSLCCESMPVFNNLKVLRIKSDMYLGWQAIPVLLRNCPHLETLVFEGLLHFLTDKCGDACNCISREDKGRSLTSCPVKKLQIKGFRGTNRELNMIENFLKSFPCLKEMEIFAEENDRTCLKSPGNFEIVVKMFKLYDQCYTCDVKFMVRGSLHKKWTAQW